MKVAALFQFSLVQRRLQLSSRVSGIYFLGGGRATLVQRRLQPISVNDCNLFSQEQEGCSLVPGYPACFFWDEEELVWLSEGCSLVPGYQACVFWDEEELAWTAKAAGKLEGCSLVPGSPACVFWDEEELAWSSEDCSLFQLMIVIFS